MTEIDLQAEAESFKETFARLKAEVGRQIVGQSRLVDGVLIALFCGGNVLLEGVPGLGKTELIKTLARALDLEFNRIQFTPDLMPADIVGTNMFVSDEAGRHRFEFRRGPVFTQMLLADEINRATPKTQSALLETMQEGSVTTGGHTYVLKKPFFVMATQNPLEQEGTYPLPEAQLDRFMFKLSVPFPSREELAEIVSRTILKAQTGVERLLDSTRILALREALGKVVVAPPLLDYAIRMVMATHPDSEFATEDVRAFVRWGASPRAAQSLIAAARANALASGRVHVAFEDLRRFAIDTLQHRVILNYDGQAEGKTTAFIVEGLLASLPEDAK